MAQFRLVTAGTKINDREAALREHHLAVIRAPVAFVIRPAMFDAVIHATNERFVDRLVFLYDAGDAAHTKSWFFQRIYLVPSVSKYL